MNRVERLLRTWLYATGTAYAAGAIDFVARPWAAAASLNRFGGKPIATEDAGLYNSLSAAYMATIAALALRAGADPGRRRALLPPLLVAKAASSAVLAYRFQQTGRRGFAIGAALDAALLGVTAGLYTNLPSAD